MKFLLLGIIVCISIVGFLLLALSISKKETSSNGMSKKETNSSNVLPVSEMTSWPINLSTFVVSAKPYPTDEKNAAVEIAKYLQGRNEQINQFNITIDTSSPREFNIYLEKIIDGDQGRGRVLGNPSGMDRLITYDVVSRTITNVGFTQ